jgi:hypothetical protein
MKIYKNCILNIVDEINFHEYLYAAYKAEELGGFSPEDIINNLKTFLKEDQNIPSELAPRSLAAPTIINQLTHIIMSSAPKTRREESEQTSFDKKKTKEWNKLGLDLPKGRIPQKLKHHILQFCHYLLYGNGSSLGNLKSQNYFESKSQGLLFASKILVLLGIDCHPGKSSFLQKLRKTFDEDETKDQKKSPNLYHLFKDNIYLFNESAEHFYKSTLKRDINAFNSAGVAGFYKGHIISSMNIGPVSGAPKVVKIN